MIENRPSWKNETGNLNWFQKIWTKAAHEAAKETNLPQSTFPPYPAWTTEEILNPDFFPLSAQERDPCADDDFSIGY